MPVQLTHQYQKLLAPILGFLRCATPEAWIQHASQPERLPLVLIDHLHCELKAAQSAGLLLRRYALDDAMGQQVLNWLRPYEDRLYRKQEAVDQGAKNKQVPRIRLQDAMPWQERLVDRMVLLMKEELHHFDQVFEIIEQRGFQLFPVTASRYAASMLRKIRGGEQGGLVDKLIIGAIIEARSCERFAALAPVVDDELARFYVSLLRSEARHYEDYLALAEEVAGQDISERVDYFLDIEKTLIETPDSELRFHSGVPLHSKLASEQGLTAQVGASR
ncbi:tRNA-(ms[2]io[6]A)-hydroxylase [Aliidiomarina halalkaliphila]|uniref:tRNA-(Ms[2]io[6]A)-hydroxylase n=1 Tax=Aliidiomarina halalkaliphila TaxID=2593535 RepID=A0A552X2R0_9GAMM|nr:tRNA isopentenyl-2-thiomethyl-A-37 hydroxylase MiaE [Aliidiomarina halalkaliphila]TRW49318.1 tRNA-(ms[2]io[6]A)-hydroxylase [Aliidiomarina halalkaliphila]